uniref:Putative GPI ceramide remodelase n=1 Tax=Ogataea minuta TaxID=36026 RepID=A0A292G9V6_9ASCO|nr:putative GPI ceramide remodelase [Ogataea minuta]
MGTSRFSADVHPICSQFIIMAVPDGPNSQPLVRLNSQAIAIAHSVCSLSAFLAALAVGCWLHFYKIVENEYYGYPDEWFPSVSATIGDRYPERSIFQILIALTAGPRFLLLLLTYVRLHKANSVYPKLALISGFIRTITCGGWVYITSTDDHDAHDVFMISYIVLTIPWDLAITKLSPPRSRIRRARKYTAWTFFGALVPLVYLFIQHKVHHVKGAYSYYAYCEWALIFLDVGFDAWSILDFKDLIIELRPSATRDEFFSANFDIKLIQDRINGTSSSSAPTSSGKLLPKSTQFSSSFWQLTVDTINWFVFWSVYSSLFLCIWYFPLWYMGISGYEAVCVLLLTPFVLAVPKVKLFFTKRPQVARTLTCLFGVGAYLVVDPACRLMVIGAAVSFATIALSTEVAAIGKLNDQLATKTFATSFTMGLILSSLAKFAFWTNNPIWPIMNSDTGGWNLTGLVVGLTAAAFTKLPQGTVSEKGPLKTQKPSLMLSAMGFGSLIFSISAMLTDSSTIVLWTWEGYPINGPIPVPHGAVTVIFMCLGAFFGFYRSSSYKSVTYAGVLGALFLYYFNGWISYAGGLAYAFWLCFITPVCFDQVSKVDGVALVFGLSFLFDIVLSLAHVWVVAYAFVPGGPLLRERTDIILSVSVLMICGLVFNYKQSEVSHSKRLKSSLKKITNYLIFFTLLSGFIAFNRFQFEKPRPYHPQSRLVTAGIWTIHFGLDNDMWASEHRMRDLIKDLELDVVGLLESDTQRIIMGNRDLTQRIAEELGMYADFGPNPTKHTWGAALLSKFPIINSTHHLLPSPVGELAPAIHATLDCYGELVDVVVFHSGQEEDVEDRRLQSLGVSEIMGSSERPMILLSYLVTEPLKGNYNTYVSDKSGMHDIDATDDDRWCEYILYKKLKRTGYARISRGSITDTEVQVGKFIIPSNGDYDESYSQQRIDEETVDPDLRFPSMFYGDGVRDHKFHVFEEPRYYL